MLSDSLEIVAPYFSAVEGIMKLGGVIPFKSRRFAIGSLKGDKSKVKDNSNSIFQI